MPVGIQCDACLRYICPSTARAEICVCFVDLTLPSKAFEKLLENQGFSVKVSYYTSNANSRVRPSNELKHIGVLGSAVFLSAQAEATSCLAFIDDIDPTSVILSGLDAAHVVPSDRKFINILIQIESKKSKVAPTVVSKIETTLSRGTLEIPRMISGLWQLAGGHDTAVDFDVAAAVMDALAHSGLGAFDMADHYGVAAQSTTMSCSHLWRNSQREITSFTKWCPIENGIKTFRQASDAVDLALSRSSSIISTVQESSLDIPGDCGDEDLGHCRALRTGNTIRISGTTANSSVSTIPVVGGSFARSQTVAIMDIIEKALHNVGASLSGIVQTRIMIWNEHDCEQVSLAHGWAMKCAGIWLANTLVVAGLIGKIFPGRDRGGSRDSFFKAAESEF
ncbi:endoribonuclease L-PSP [Drepanopeziza brunnea f. sp. 'multigermtubi' MB_m1]|uniref:Endoribonuclease L-PSP n=1 Tax=Marssonina brunnea f. sp. multigermtubi (strain MB_m1) TaxID=1072389 RepID=K1WWI8_MARBU|nr:endoribonuclease L-PSP [Drepanopeziza brunnea f. sp. 'multigermtubi' MB_m1]EKD13033.1 endoribonuclease L-PSP [Drepanopeziza brunnea f. sp. 'multigermtubi' MB_m1]